MEEIEAGGDSFFRAVADQLYGDQNVHSWIRYIVHVYMVRDPIIAIYGSYMKICLRGFSGLHLLGGFSNGTAQILISIALMRTHFSPCHSHLHLIFHDVAMIFCTHTLPLPRIHPRAQSTYPERFRAFIDGDWDDYLARLQQAGQEPDGQPEMFAVSEIYCRAVHLFSVHERDEPVIYMSGVPAPPPAEDDLSPQQPTGPIILSFHLAGHYNSCRLPTPEFMISLPGYRFISHSLSVLTVANMHLVSFPWRFSNASFISFRPSFHYLGISLCDSLHEQGVEEQLSELIQEAVGGEDGAGHGLRFANGQGPADEEEQFNNDGNDGQEGQQYREEDVEEEAEAEGAEADARSVSEHDDGRVVRMNAEQMARAYDDEEDEKEDAEADARLAAFEAKVKNVDAATGRRTD